MNKYFLMEKKFGKIFSELYLNSSDEKNRKKLLDLLPKKNLKDFSGGNGVGSIFVTGCLLDVAPSFEDLDYGMDFTLYSDIQKKIIAFNSDESVKEIKMFFNTPGGIMTDLLDTMKCVRNSTKNITGIILEGCYSAGYFLGSQCDKLFLKDEISGAGSIGIMISYLDNKTFLENLGFKEVVIVNDDSKNKVLDLATEDGKLQYTKTLNSLYKVFGEYLADGRGVTLDFVNSNFGNGGNFVGADLIEKDMVDGFVENFLFKKEKKFLLKEKTGYNKKDLNIVGINKKENKSMVDEIKTLEDLKKNFPQLLKEFKGEVVLLEQKRVSGWLHFISVDSEIVKKGILGKEEIDVPMAAELAMKKSGLDVLKKAVDDNPIDIVAPEVSKNDENVIKELKNKIKVGI